MTDSTLIGVTLLSMAMAASLSVIVWRLLRDERHRSEARITALTSMAAGASPRERRPAAPGREPAADLPLRPTAASPAPILFVEPERSSPWRRRFAVMAGLGLIAASAILLALTVNDRAAGRRARDLTSVATAGNQSVQKAPTPGPGLELLSLRDSRQSGSLTITGLVQNPRSGAPLSRVTVTAYVFDDKGSFLASGRALIDVTALAPGDESPFIVSVPVTETVARYRIGFRGEDGRVIAHVDKRQQSPVAANW